MNHSSTMDILYTVFAPLSGPLGRTRWKYYQFTDGTAERTITTKTGFEGAPDALQLSTIFPDALSWSRCLHEGKPQFADSSAATELYRTLCNAAMHDAAGRHYLAEVCAAGMIEDLQEWIRQLKAAEAQGENLRSSAQSADN